MVSTVRHGGAAAYGACLLDMRRPGATVDGVQDHPDDGLPDDGLRADDSGGGPAPEGDLPFPGALGVDPEHPDPGCEHEWRNLLFLDEDEGLVCTRCGRDWALDEEDARDAVLALWHSTRRAVEDLHLRQERVTRIIEALTGTLRCHWCDRWSDDPDAFVAVGDRRGCPEHLGQLLAETVPADDGDVAVVTDWLTAALADDPGDVYPAWLAEKAAVEYPGLAGEGGPASGLGARRVVLADPWSGLLGTQPVLDVNAVARAVARLLELPAPTSRPGRALLLGTLALAVRAREQGGTANAEDLAELLLEAAPTGNRDRATVVLDLYRSEMQADGTVTGEMADDLVEALIGRAASEFAPAVIDATATDTPTGHDPR